MFWWLMLELLSLLWTCPEVGAEPGEMKGGQNTPDVHRFYTLCPPPRFLVSLKALNQQQRLKPRALSAPLASAWAIKTRLFLVRRDQISSLIFQLSLCWSGWRMRNLPCALQSWEIFPWTMAGGVAALLKAERPLLLHITPLHKNSGFCQ